MKVNEIKKAQPSWNVVAFGDLEDCINCASCGKEVAFGDAYTSREHETDKGWGLTICERCNEQEYKEVLKNRYTEN
jgi:hypothetical protein